MKKLLTILTSCSAVFLITASIILVNKNNGENNIQINKQIKKKSHKYQGEKLTQIGYYWDNFEKQVRIEQIPSTVKVIAAQLPEEITSLKGAFQARTNDVNWTIPWDTKRITNMNSMFYNTTWFNNSSIADWDTSNVTDMGEMFGRSRSFNQDLSKWDVSKVKNFKKMFYNAKKYNNNNKPLKWNDKLKSVVNMESMFQGASSFKHSLQDWKLEKEVNNKNFGLSDDRHPKWKEKLVKPSTPINLPNSSSSNNINERSDNNQINRNSSTPTNSNTISTNPNNDLSSNTTNNENISESSMSNNMLEIPINSENKPENPKNNENINYKILPKVDKTKKQSEAKNKIPVEKGELSKDENQTTKTSNAIKDKENSSIKSDSLYKIPPKPNTIISKANSSNAGVIAGSVLGSFTILGTSAGVGYYYRKNLKNLYLKSTDKLKPSLLKSKDNIKDFYFKSKNKIKDKIAKIRSKK
ncbi:Putative variable surface protein [Mycoplasma leachii 99/014/6]|uniref:Myrrcad domain-containing protein n=1 Tax=Mycoplasma leachii TaxID=2105 RepID=UPI000217714B|nr:Myrrcad domain-containing protein [Mycoplasma leachii]CBV67447.1 Putative variable surface protein [Mycoplasma leachii 99/014/6]